jgi:hypothetical protein
LNYDEVQVVGILVSDLGIYFDGIQWIGDRLV